MKGGEEDGGSNRSVDPLLRDCFLAGVFCRRLVASHAHTEAGITATPQPAPVDTGAGGAGPKISSSENQKRASACDR